MHTKKLFAESISVDIIVKGNKLLFPYKVKFPDKSLEETFEVIYEFDLNLTKSQIDLLKLGMTIFLAQTFLAKKIDSDIPVKKCLWPYYNKLLELLYNLRNYKEQTDITPPRFEKINFLKNLDFSQNNTQKDPDKKKAANLISGGKDSLSAALLLEQNGFEIINCFISGFNLASGNAELTACKKLYKNFHIIYVKGFEKILNVMSEINIPNEKPSTHTYTIIYARDLLSIFFIIPVALWSKANYISFGAERDVWKSNIKGKYGPIPMQDTQSELTLTVIHKIIKIVTPQIHLFSPIAGLHEITLLSWLLKNKPSLVSKMSSCFHGNWCGQCWKCSRYYLIQKYMDVDVIPFKSNPLNPMSESLQKFYENNLIQGAPYNEEILFLLEKLNIHENETPNNSLRGLNSPIISIIDTNDLFCSHSAKLIPRGFKRKLR